MPRITEESLTDSFFRHVAHLDGRDAHGSWFADLMQCVAHPRVTKMLKTWRKRGKASETIWGLDGEMIGTLANTLAAYKALPIPPVSITERTILEQIGEKWMAPPMAPIHLMSLRDKGLIEFHDRNNVRRTRLGNEVLSEEE